MLTLSIYINCKMCSNFSNIYNFKKYILKAKKYDICKFVPPRYYFELFVINNLVLENIC